MCENSSSFQHRYFFDEKSLFDDEFLQIHKHRYDHDEQFFKTVLHLSFSVPFKILHTCCSCNVCNLAHYVEQRTVLDYTIVYDEAISGSIGGHILFAVKFYAYIHSDALDGFVLSRAINDRKRLSR